MEARETRETMETMEPRKGRETRETKDRARLESDARQDRMDRVAVLFGEITAATREFLRALAESDRHHDWAEESFGSCAEWLAWRIGITRNTANEKVRAALALEGLPLISDAMGRGEISYSKVRSLTRAATADNESELLELARAGSAANLERLVRSWKTLDRSDEQRAERMRHRSRCLSVFPDEGGMYVVKGRLTPEVAAVLMRAVEAASDALFAEHSAGHSKNDGERTEPEQLRADAVGLLAERALAAGFGGDKAPVSGSRAERYQVMLHVEPDTVAEQGEPGMSELEDGTRVSAETARRLACDAGRVDVRRDADGSVLDVGRRTRTVPSALRRALEARDRGCRFPGCGLRFTDAHHIVHWADGGETVLANMLLLCRRHHRRVHEDGYSVCSDAHGQIVFFTPKGKAFAEVPPMPEPPPIPQMPEPPELQQMPELPPMGDSAHMPEHPPDPFEELVRRNRERGITPDWRSGMPKWKRDHDIPWEIEYAALEAVLSSGESHEGEPENEELKNDERENNKPFEHAA